MEGGLTGVTKAEVVSAERAKLTELFASVEEPKRRLVAELIENAAFLAGELAEEREMLQQTGMVRVNPADPRLQKPVEAARQYRQNLGIYAVVIKALNGGSASTQLGNWLAATFPDMLGARAGANDLTGKSNAAVAEFYRALFAAKKLPGSGPAKLDVQVMAVALAVYVTNQTLAGTTAASYGFLVTESGVGALTFNIGTSGAAFGVADGTEMVIMDILLATNDRTISGVLYDTNGDGVVQSSELLLRALANTVYTAINEAGQV